MQAPSLTKSSSQVSKWKPYNSWRYPRDLQRSIPQMSAQQVQINLVEINLCAYYNSGVLEMVENKMLEMGFYLRNRHVLGNLMNAESREKGLDEKIGKIVKRFDEIFVKGVEFGKASNSNRKENEKNSIRSSKNEVTEQLKNSSKGNGIEKLSKELEEKELVKQYFEQQTKSNKQITNRDTNLSNRPISLKQVKAELIVQRQKFILSLSRISDRLFECKQGKTEDDVRQKKRHIFTQSLHHLNQIIYQYRPNSQNPNLSNQQSQPNSLPTQLYAQQSKPNCQMQQFSQIFSQHLTISHSKPLYQPKQQPNPTQKLPLTPYIFYFKHQLHSITHISILTSSFIPTKNRNPLKLDFGFGQFIYKNDDQLAHQIIAMQFIKYMNKIFGAEYIQEYEIMPEVRGAFYECVKARTLAQIKRDYQDLGSYFKLLAQQRRVDVSVIQKRFGQSYAGYCMAQFMLQIKDRNNANIMLKPDGTFFHIDLAFIFNAKPGGISFQSAPFKMTKQYVKAMGGFESDNFKYFESLLIQMITKIYESKEEFLFKLDILGSRSKEIRCFAGFDIQKYRSTKIVKSLEQARDFVEHLIDESFDNWRTKKYDTYQWKTNNIPA